jgi:holo-[acyl-carrier protein] synthase
MKQAHIGTDIIEISRLRDALARWGEHFSQRVYTEAELRLCRGRAESLAARFAGKEAVMKALGGEGVGLNWKEIEILAESGGKPILELHGATRGKAEALGLKNLEISLSHSRDLAIAFVVGISD